MSSVVLIAITAIITLIGKKFGKVIFHKVHQISGIKTDIISNEEAAMICLEKKVEFVWRPQIIDKPIVSNVVDFDDVKIKKVKRKRHEAKV